MVDVKNSYANTKLNLFNAKPYKHWYSLKDKTPEALYDRPYMT